MSELRIIDDYRCIIENVHTYRYRYIVYLSGRMGLAKSTNISAALLIGGLLRPLRVVCVRETQNSIKDSVYTQLCDCIREHGLPYTIFRESIVGPNGTEFIFKGLRDTNQHNIRSMTNIDVCWVEEAQSLSATSWESLVPTIRKKGSFIIISGNPDEESDIVYQEFGPNSDRRPDAYYCYKDYRYNPFELPESTMLDIEMMRKNRPDEWRRVYLGKLRTMSDMPVVKSWSAKNVGVGQKSAKIYWSLDFNVNPQCSVIAHWNGDRDFYFSDEIVLANAATLDVAEEFVRLYRKKYNGQMVIINGDASGRNRSSNSEYSNYAIIQNVLTKHKVPHRFNVPKANTSIRNRVSNFDYHVHGIDGKEHILVDPSCVHLIHACKLLGYDKQGNIIETPARPGMKTIDYAKSHIFDAASYCVMINDPVLQQFLKKEKPRILTLRERFEASARQAASGRRTTI